MASATLLAVISSSVATSDPIMLLLLLLFEWLCFLNWNTFNLRRFKTTVRFGLGGGLGGGFKSAFSYSHFVVSRKKRYPLAQFHCWGIVCRKFVILHLTNSDNCKYSEKEFSTPLLHHNYRIYCCVVCSTSTFQSLVRTALVLRCRDSL